MVADGKLIFSKAKVSRFPEDGEVEEDFEALRAGKGNFEPSVAPAPAVDTPAGKKGLLQRLFSRN